MPNYNFDFHMKQEDVVLSIIEGRMVPRDLSEFHETENINKLSFIYLDNNGVPEKLSLEYLKEETIKIVDKIPQDALLGQIIFIDGVLKKQISENRWVDLLPVTNADLVNFEDSNVKDTLVHLLDELARLDQGSVKSINNITGDVNLIGDGNIDVFTEGNNITINGEKLTPTVKFLDLESIVNAHLENFDNPHNVTKEQLGLGEVDNTSDLDKPISLMQAEKNAELDAKDALQDQDRARIENKFDGEVARLDGRIDTEHTNIANLDNQINTRVTGLSEDVYHKAEIKNIALTGKAVDVTVEALPNIVSTELQGVLDEINRRTIGGGTTIVTEKLETPEAGFAASYRVLQDTLSTGVSINVPFGYELTNTELTVDEEHKATLHLTFMAGDVEKVVDVDLSSLVTDGKLAVDLEEINAAINTKQDKLTAGPGIAIEKDEETDELIIKNTMNALEWGNLTGTIADQTDLQAELDLKANKAEIEASLEEEVNRASDKEAEIITDVTEFKADMAEFKADVDTFKETINSDLLNAKTELNDSISAEKERAEAKELELSTSIETEVENRTSADSTLTAAIEAEETRAKAKETELEESLSAEITRAEEKETALEESISAETTRAEGKETELAEAISAESTARSEADTALEDKLNSEISDRETAISELEDKVNSIDEELAGDISEVSTNLAAEITRATQAEAGLANDITQEINNRETAVTAEKNRAEGVEDGLNTRLTSAEGSISTIENKIPNEASSENQLADKAFVTSTVSTETAYYRGMYDSVDELPTEGNTNNDYAIIKIVDEVTGFVKEYDKYKYNAKTQEWSLEYPLNNSTFTAEQWAAINSGATSTLFAEIATKLDNNATAIADEATARQEKDTALETSISTHTGNISNPHNVTKAQVGLGNVENIAPANLPVSTATQTELDKKVDKVEGYALSKNDLTDVLKAKLDNISAEAKKVEKSDINGNIKIDGTEITVYTEIEHTVHDAAYKHIDVTETSVTDGTKTFNKYVHPTTTAATAAAVKVGKDELGHVVIGSALTKSDVGLVNVDNTSDLAKPVSTATQAELNKKVDKVDGYGLSKNDLTDVLKNKLDAISEGANKVESSGVNGNIKIDGVETKVYTEVANTVHDANYRHITVTPDSVTDGTQTFNKFVLAEKFNETVNASKDINANKINAPVSAGAASANYGVEGQILTADGNGGVYWKDGYKPGTGVSVTGQYISTTYTTCDIPTSAWTTPEEATYSMAVIDVAGVKEVSNPTLDVLITKDNIENVDALNEAWSKIFSAETSNGKISFYATEAPVTDITVQVKGY